MKVMEAGRHVVVPSPLPLRSPPPNRTSSPVFLPRGPNPLAPRVATGAPTAGVVTVGEACLPPRHRPPSLGTK